MAAMSRLMLSGLTMLALPNCSTDPCDCPPGIIPGVVIG